MRKALLFISLLICSQVFAQSQTQPQSQPDETPPATEIFVVPIRNGRIEVAQTRNITNRKGYDNQPSFLADGKALFYTSIDEDEQADIFLYDLSKQKKSRITQTPESEYSPTLMPDGKFLSTVRVEKDETQRLWKFPVRGGDPILLLDEIKPVGYHTWLNSNTVALFILGEPPTLQIADLRTGKTTVVAENIGRSLHKVPGKQTLSFVNKRSKKGWTIEEYDPSTLKTSALIVALPESEDYVWTPHGSMLMAKNGKIYGWNPGKDKHWKELADFEKLGLNGITRIAVSPRGDWIAFVAHEP